MKKITTASVSSILCLTACSLIMNSGPAQATSQKVGVANSEPATSTNLQQDSASQWWQQSTDLSKLSQQTPRAEMATEAGQAARYQEEPIQQQAENPRFNELTSEQPAPTPQPVLEFGQSYSTAAGDLTATPASTPEYAGIPQTESAPQQISQFEVEGRIPGANFIGIGANIGDNEDVLDLAILSKIRFFTFGSEDRPWTLSARPTLAFSNGIVDLRLPATVEFKQVTLDTGEPADRYTPYAGAGFAVSLDDDSDSEFDFMLTGGLDYLLSDAFTLTAMINLLFLDDVDVEGQFGVGFNF